MLSMIGKELQAHKETIEKTIAQMIPDIHKASKLMVDTLKSGHKILLCGNGGSAADAQHIAAELTGRYKSQRRGLPAIALTTDTSVLTAIANDYGYEHIFDRQVEALAHQGDLLIGISTSGNSANVLSALTLAKASGCHTLAMNGRDGGEMNALCDVTLTVPSEDTPRIQEMHILIGHILCQAVDNEVEFSVQNQATHTTETEEAEHINEDIESKETYSEEEKRAVLEQLNQVRLEKQAKQEQKEAQEKKNSKYTKETKEQILEQLNQKRLQEQKAKENKKKRVHNKKKYTIKGKEYYKFQKMKREYYIEVETCKNLSGRPAIVSLLYKTFADPKKKDVLIKVNASSDKILVSEDILRVYFKPYALESN